MASTYVRIEGLQQLRRSFRESHPALRKELSSELRATTQRVVVDVRRVVPLGPAKGGHVRNSIKGTFRWPTGAIQGGGSRYPYYPWLEFGGSVSRGRVVRPRVPGGRYLYPTAEKRKAQFEHDAHQGVERALRKVGL